MTSMDLPTTQTTPESLEPPIQKSFSCVLCAQRKVKCDKRPGGCANCTKARVTCIYKAPPPPRRRRKGVREVDLTTRMRIYEEALRKLGVDPDLLVKEELSKVQPQKDFVSSSDVKIYTSIEPKTLDVEKEEGGVLVMDKGRSRYLENGLWTSLRDEFGDSKDFLDESTDEEEEKAETRAQLTPESSPYDASSLLLGGSRVNASLRHLHPQPAQIYKLWQTYLDNVNPLVKVFHAPTIQQMITNAAGNLDEISKSVEVLLFCIYCISLESLSNLECDAVMGEPKAVVSQRFRAAAQHALINASFLKTSDIMVLQALTLFILSLQNDDARIIWTLAGIAQRIAQRLGLHRDPEGLGLPPFEVQIRRRLWWQIIMLEGFSQKLAGTGGALYVDNVKLPLNINDGELYMGMKETPKEHQGATEMMHFLIRCHVGDFLRRTALNGAFRNFDGAWNGLTSKNVSFAVKEKAIRELEGTLRTKFLQNIDQSIPWHVLCSFLVQAIINMMMFTAYNPYIIRGIPPSEKDFLFEMSHQVITGQNLAYTRSEMQNYLWHINLHFQWKAFIYLVSELRFRHHGPKVDDAWKQVELVYDFHPNFAKDLSRRALPIAIGRLTLKAWDAYSAARGISPDPYFIQILRTRQNRSKSVDTMSQTTSNATPQTDPTKHIESSSAEFKAAAPSNDLQPLSWNTDLATSLDTDPTTDIPYFPPIDPEQMNWSNWDNLLDEFQLQDGDGNLLPTEHVTNFGFGGL